MQATMFNEAARKFFDKLEIGKVYYISKGTIKVANKQFRTIHNDFEMTLNEYSQVEEGINESMLVPERNFNFVSIDQLGPHVNQKELVDVIGVVQHVSPTTSIRRKRDQQIIPKRDITIVDETKKSVVVTLWSDHATYFGQELLDMASKSPILAMKSLKVGYFRGVNLSALPDSYFRINPYIPQCLKLRSWYDSEGLETTLAPIGSCLKPSLTTNPTLGEDKHSFFNTRACMTFVNPDRTITYRACNTCNKKVSGSTIGSGYWCDRCQSNQETCKLRYSLFAKFSDVSGEAWFSIFNEDAETLLGCSPDDLAKMKEEVPVVNYYVNIGLFS